jgi:hypothetical protein
MLVAKLLERSISAVQEQCWFLAMIPLSNESLAPRLMPPTLLVELDPRAGRWPGRVRYKRSHEDRSRKADGD